MVNEIHGLHLLLCSANSFTMVVATLFRIYMGVVERNYGFMLINNILWLLYAAQFGIMCGICTYTSRESDKTATFIYTILLNREPVCRSKLTGIRNQLSLEIPPQLNGQNTEQNCDQNASCCMNNFTVENYMRTNLERDCLRNEVNDFSIQLQQHRITFTACDFFEMNNALLTGVSISIFSFKLFDITKRLPDYNRIIYESFFSLLE